MKIKVYQAEEDRCVDMDVIGKYKFIGNSNGLSLVEGKEYYRVGNEDEFRIVDESYGDFLYAKEDFEESV